MQTTQLVSCLSLHLSQNCIISLGPCTLRFQPLPPAFPAPTLPDYLHFRRCDSKNACSLLCSREERNRTFQFIYQKSLKLLTNGHFRNTISEILWRAIIDDGIVSSGNGKLTVFVTLSSSVPFRYHIKALKKKK